MEDKNMIMARSIAEEVAKHGGRVYYVGGSVRDALLGRENKDIDIEVHGVTVKTLETILDSLGKRSAMGASFGIYSLSHYDLDIAFPRAESSASGGKADMEQAADPFIGPENAARRRDLTINAMMQDVLTGEILDYFGGQEDLKNRTIRCVAPETFAEDPLRVLRAAQFAARLDFQIEEETAAFASTLDLSGLAWERIFTELEKALLKSPRPSVFFESLRKMNQLDKWFPEVQALIGVEQEPMHHPEGDVWNHTMLVLDQAAKLRSRAEEPLEFMLAALCHDFGKPQTTAVIDGRIRAFGHEQAGVPIAEKFLSRITTEIKLKKYVSNMILLHMRPNILAGQHSGRKAVVSLLDSSVCPGDLLLLAQADDQGRTINRDYAPTESWLWENLSYYNELMSRPFVKGADLIQAGYKPGKDFSEALEHAHKLRLAGVAKDKALPQVTAFLRNLRRI